MRLSAVVALGACPLVVVAAAAVTTTVAEGGGGSEPVPVVVAVDGDGATIGLPDGRAAEGLLWLQPGDGDPAISPDGRRVAFASSRDGNREIYVGDTETGHLQRLTHSAEREDGQPAWSPNGTRISWSSGSEGSHDLFVMRADGTGRRGLVRREGDDVEPDWSPDGQLVAFASDVDGRFGLWTVPAAGGEPIPLGELPGDARAPAWHPSGDRIAYTGIVSANADVWVVGSDGSSPRVLVGGPGYDGRPRWASDGRSIGFVRGRGSLAPWLARADGSRAAAWPAEPRAAAIELAEAGPTLAPRPEALLPDLDQRPPASLVIRTEKGRTLLGFASAVDNIGLGPLRLRGTRAPDARVMRADQIVESRRRALVVRRGIGEMRFEPHPPHHHWHLEPFDRYELRRASNGELLRRDRKTGFCLLDRWGTAPLPDGRRRGPPRFLGDCKADRPDARTVEEGSSVGYTDRYPQFFHGQEVDVTELPAGLYTLVHRANPERRVREVSFANDVASVLIRLTRGRGPTMPPKVAVLRACDRTDRCAPVG